MAPMLILYHETGRKSRLPWVPRLLRDWAADSGGGSGDRQSLMMVRSQAELGNEERVVWPSRGNARRLTG